MIRKGRPVVDVYQEKPNKQNEKVEDKNQYSSRLQHLEQRTYHIDGEVTAIKSQLSAQSDTLTRIENSILNKQPMWNVGNIMGLLVVAGSLILGLVTYTHTLINPLGARMDVYDAFRYEMHYEVGQTQHSIKTLDEKFDHFDELHHKQDDMIIGFTKGLAASEVEHRALGDYAKETRELLNDMRAGD